MPEIVYQRARSDCVIAAVATATGRRYEAVLEAAGDLYDPDRGTARACSVVEALGFEHRFENGEQVGDFTCYHRPWCLSGTLYRAMIWGRRALVSAPSLNLEGSSHMVYFDGRQVLDPNPPGFKRYTAFVELEPTALILFREGVLP